MLANLVSLLIIIYNCNENVKTNQIHFREEEEEEMGLKKCGVLPSSWVVFFLFLFSITEGVRVGRPKVFNVVGYGAIPDGTTDNSKVSPVQNWIRGSCGLGLNIVVFFFRHF